MPIEYRLLFGFPEQDFHIDLPTSTRLARSLVLPACVRSARTEHANVTALASADSYVTKSLSSTKVPPILARGE